MSPSQATAKPRGVVVAYMSGATRDPAGHAGQTLLDFVRRLALLRGEDPAGFHAEGARYPGSVYFVPHQTLDAAEAAALGVRGPQDLFGGVVPQPFVATKAISHPPLAPERVLADWNAGFAERVADAVLEGYVAFHLDDAREAGRRLLARGPVRIKPPWATGGLGQTVARDDAELAAQLAALDPARVAAQGLVLEQNLSQVRTFSVGQVAVGPWLASYWGEQRSTRNNRGEEAFGGSDLVVARGDFDALLRLGPPPEIARAIEQACRFDAAVRASFPGFFASRSNYDVAWGQDAQGRWRSGVLEQSWRAGGATGCELAALEVFQRRPACMRVRTAGYEIFGESPEPPAGARVHFRGVDPKLGPLTKYTLIHPDDDTREHD